MKIPTPHNEAGAGETAKTVLMPGDPRRTRLIAKHYLDDYVCFNTVRNMLGYTGIYRGKRPSVMGSGIEVHGRAGYGDCGAVPERRQNR